MAHGLRRETALRPGRMRSRHGEPPGAGRLPCPDLTGISSYMHLASARCRVCRRHPPARPAGVCRSASDWELRRRRRSTMRPRTRFLARSRCSADPVMAGSSRARVSFLRRRAQRDPVHDLACWISVWHGFFGPIALRRTGRGPRPPSPSASTIPLSVQLEAGACALSASVSYRRRVEFAAQRPSRCLRTGPAPCRDDRRRRRRAVGGRNAPRPCHIRPRRHPGR